MNSEKNLLTQFSDEDLLQELLRRKINLSPFYSERGFEEESEMLVRNYVIACSHFLYLSRGEELIKEVGFFKPELMNEWEDAICLQVDFETGEVMSHEGRHRVAAMLNSGYTHTRIILDLCTKKFLYELAQNFSLEKIDDFFCAQKPRIPKPADLFPGSLIDEDKI